MHSKHLCHILYIASFISKLITFLGTINKMSSDSKRPLIAEAVCLDHRRERGFSAV
jgi:hypothetical protein